MLIKYDKAITSKYPELFTTIQDSYLKQKILFIINSKYRKAVNLRMWLRDYVETDQKGLFDAVLDLIPSTPGDYDSQVINCLKYVYKHIKYVGDPEAWEMDEYWQTPGETIIKKTGDCEDGAILLYYLCRMKGVPAERLHLIVGGVTGGRHCWLSYKPQEYPLNYAFLDWCYWVKLTNMPLRDKYYIDKENKIHTFNYEGISKPSGYDVAEFAWNETTNIKSFKYNSDYRT